MSESAVRCPPSPVDFCWEKNSLTRCLSTEDDEADKYAMRVCDVSLFLHPRTRTDRYIPVYFRTRSPRLPSTALRSLYPGRRVITRLRERPRRRKNIPLGKGRLGKRHRGHYKADNTSSTTPTPTRQQPNKPGDCILRLRLENNLRERTDGIYSTDTTCR